MSKTRKLLLVFLAATMLLTYFSCKKNDLSPGTNVKEPNDVEEKFFNGHRSNDPVEKALVGFMKRRNEKSKFVGPTVSQIGYPRWDKMITKATSRTNGQDGDGSSSTTYYLPFVRESQDHVNAAMVIDVSAKDTSFSYRCDWQYLSKQNKTTAIADSAEYFAVFFMVLDKNVFGHSKFKIKDPNLFRNGSHKTLNVSLDQEGAPQVSNLMAIEVCADVTIYFNDCTYQGYPECTPTCDGCWECTSYISYQYCWEEWVDGGGGGGGGGSGGGGTGGGGGGSGGGDTPPECDEGPVPFSASDNILPPCDGGGGGGWEPEPPVGPLHTEGAEVAAAPFNTWDVQTFPLLALPSWADYNANYPKNSSGDELGVAEVYQMAGGPLYNAYLADNNAYGNACALRTSIALVKSGINIPYIKSTENGVTRDVTRQGANGKYYFITATDLYNWMRQTFGTPPGTHIVERPEAPDGQFASRLPADNGIYIMRALNRTEFGATGHVTLFAAGAAVQGGDLFGSNIEVGGGIRDVTLWKLN